MAKIYYSTQPVWWNTGNEIKPNRAAFNKFTFTQADNFNISWVDEMTIEVIVPNQNLCTLIKIEDNIDNITKYFYLLEVVNRTSVNQECVYELDVWLTYLLPYLEANKDIQNINTIRTLDVSTLAPTINIDPIGVPTGRIITKKFNPIKTINQDANIFRLSGKETSYSEQVSPRPGVSTNIYYVFKSKPTDKVNINISHYFRNTEEILPNYVLVPVLDIGPLGLAITENYDSYIKQSGQLGGWAPQPKQAIHQVLNSAYNLNELVRIVADFGSFNGLGDFLGVWVGPNFFRFKNSGIKVLRQMTGGAISQPVYDVYNTTNIMFRPNDGNPNHNFKSYDAGTEWCTFLALRVSSIPLELTPILNHFEYNNLLTGLKYQENPDSNVIINANSVSFNNSFSYSNGLQTTTTNIALPVAHDIYYNLLAAQRNTLNTSLGLSAMNSILSGLSPLPGIVPPTPSTTLKTYNETKDYFQAHLKAGNIKKRITQKGPRGGLITMGWEDKIQWRKPKSQKQNKQGSISTIHTPGKNVGGYYGAGLGVASAGAQFISTLAQQRAYKEDLRIATSSAVLNENDRYLNWYKIASTMPTLTKAQTDNKTGDQIKSLLNTEFLSGAETEPGIAYRFYGVDSQPQVVSITDTMEAYLQITDNQALSLQNQWGTSYTPTIKAGMLSLLTEGIRITGDIIK